ncbi:hypothetical protein MHC_02505 [Mycoplasma haemocanis str. Illinois]|uniref:Uncharacterized protein n=1 Tax=Mycoplasma haemocanis (strain Illinois) TaxID=1111676 RepID=H6N6U3_MYCHN|nr:hypothetical protein [Mycoplasma haemocanis]AEW45365.2 hypothetical protein MHC_02505 [Mycoplasma haemocanis str. Illinois]
MVLSTMMKSLLGGTLLAAGAGLGIGQAIFFPGDSNSENLVKTSVKSSTEDQSESEENGNSPGSKGDEDSKGGTSGSQVTGEQVVTSEVSGSPQTQTSPAKQEEKCTVYKILSSVDRTAFLAEDGFLENEAKKQTKHRDFKNACDKASGKKIYLSFENVGSWWYPKYEWTYNKSKQSINWNIKPNPKK